MVLPSARGGRTSATGRRPGGADCDAAVTRDRQSSTLPLEPRIVRDLDDHAEMFLDAIRADHRPTSDLPRPRPPGRGVSRAVTGDAPSPGDSHGRKALAPGSRRRCSWPTAMGAPPDELRHATRGRGALARLASTCRRSLPVVANAIAYDDAAEGECDPVCARSPPPRLVAGPAAVDAIGRQSGRQQGAMSCVLMAATSSVDRSRHQRVLTRNPPERSVTSRLRRTAPGRVKGRRSQVGSEVRKQRQMIWRQMRSNGLHSRHFAEFDRFVGEARRQAARKQVGCARVISR